MSDHQNRVYLSPPHLGEDELQQVQDIFASNWIAPAGPHLTAFEQEIVRYHGGGHCVALNSATASMHLALNCLGIGKGDVVFVQTHNHVGSVNPIIYQGATPVFIDSEEDTWNMDPDTLDKAISSYTADKDAHPNRNYAIILVHIYGMPANLNAITAVATKYGMPIIEDAAEALGSTYFNRATGTFGQIGVYSFNGNKIITTGGGGALYSSNSEMVARARYLSTQARDETPHFQHSEIGFNYRLSNVLAGIGIGQMHVLDTRVEQRRANFERYKAYFNQWNSQGFHFELQTEPAGHYSNRWLTTVLVQPERNYGLTAESMRLHLEENNIESRPLWKPMHLQPVFAEYPFFGSGISKKFFDTGLCLPSGSSLTELEFKRIFRTLDVIITTCSPRF